MTSLIRPLLLALFVVTALSALPGAAFAGAEDVAEPSPQRTTGFVAAKTPTTIPGGPLLLTAYGVVWFLLFGYLFSVRRRQVEVEDEMRDLLVEVKALRAESPAMTDAGTTEDPGES